MPNPTNATKIVPITKPTALTAKAPEITTLRPMTNKINNSAGNKATPATNTQSNNLNAIFIKPPKKHAAYSTEIR